MGPFERLLARFGCGLFWRFSIFEPGFYRELKALNEVDMIRSEDSFGFTVIAAVGF